VSRRHMISFISFFLHLFLPSSLSSFVSFFLRLFLLLLHDANAGAEIEEATRC
jgi:Na+/H+ antiporter NhaD/arsenite permease-like protein